MFEDVPNGICEFGRKSLKIQDISENANLFSFPYANVPLPQQEALLGPLGSKFDYGEAIILEDDDKFYSEGTGFGKSSATKITKDKGRRRNM